MSPFSKYIQTTICFTALSLSSSLFSVVIPVKDGEELNFALENGLSPLTIEFQNDITGGTISQNFIFPVNSDSQFAEVDKMVTINGNSFSLSPPSSSSIISIPRGLFVHGSSTTPTTFTATNLFFGSLAARGGTGTPLGGGGAGLGGALFLEKGSKSTLINPIFSNCSAQGGTALGFDFTSGAGAGGGLGGAGGQTDAIGGGCGGGSLFQDGGGVFGQNGGGGGGGVGFAGLTASGAGGGAGGGTFDGSNGGAAPGGAGGTGGGGAGGDQNTVDAGNGGSGGGGGGGGFKSSGGTSGNGGDGGDFGGGGSGGDSSFDQTPLVTEGNGGDGGFGGGGGGGGASLNLTGSGGKGGFGGGAGAGTGSPSPGFGGGKSSRTQGGGGAGFGGAIFMQADPADHTKSAELIIATEGEFIPINLFQKNQAIGGRGFENGLGEGPDIYMMSSCLLTFDLEFNVIMSNPIVGNQGVGGGDTTKGGLTKKGPALLVLKGPNTFTGMTTVDEGELHVDGSLLTDVTVNAGGVFSGTNTIQGNLLNDGVVSPGATMPNDPAKLIGSITMTGEFTQNATGKLRADLTPQGEGAADIHDKVVGASKANLAGTLEVVLDPGNYVAGTTYEVIDAPTNGTQFDSEICTGKFCDKVDIDVAYSSVIVTLLNSVLFEHLIIAPGVPSDLVNSIISCPIEPRSDFALMVETLGTLNNKQVNQALNDISAIRFGALEWINARNNSYAADILSQHLFELCCSPRDCCSCDCDGDVWVSVFGNFMDNTERYDDLPKFSANAGGLLVGLDYCSDNFYYGGAFGYTYTHLIWRDDGGSGKINSYYGALYGSWLCDCFSVDLSVLGGGSDNDLDRRINFGAVHRTAESDYWGYFVSAHLGLRGSWSWCDNVIEPFAVADYHYYTHETFTEKGANSLNLRVKSNDQHIMRAEAGVVSYREFTCECLCYAPYIGVSWVGEFPLHKSVQSASFAGQSCSTHTPTSYDSSVHLGAPQAGMKITSEDGLSLTIGYKGLFNDKTRINEAELRFDWIF